MGYGLFLCEARKAIGISRYKLWKMTGVRESTIKFWEDGKIEPTVRNFDKVLKALGVSLKIGVVSDSISWASPECRREVEDSKCRNL